MSSAPVRANATRARDIRAARYPAVVVSGARDGVRCYTDSSHNVRGHLEGPRMNKGSEKRSVESTRRKQPRPFSLHCPSPDISFEPVGEQRLARQQRLACVRARAAKAARRLRRDVAGDVA